MNYSEIENICNKYKNDCVCEKNASLANKTTMKIGGKCGLFVEPYSESVLVELLNACRRGNVPYFILGKGSNVLINSFHGVVIYIGKFLGAVTVDNDMITAGAGSSLASVCGIALENSLTGMEELFGIPGSVGGALYMNAGAYGGEMKDIVTSARCVNERGEIVTIPAEEMNLRYRGSVFSENGWCILSVTVALKAGDKTAIKARMDELMQRRRDRQPLEFPSCGSTFKRPKDGFAAALIEECGLKGYSVGGAQVSEKHSGFVINRGGATFEDVMELVAHIKSVVKKQKGVELECEMLIVDK